jgi:hypothetical protein
MIMINPLQQKLPHASPVLTFKQLNWYLNFSTQFMKNILLLTEKDKILKQMEFCGK